MKYSKYYNLKKKTKLLWILCIFCERENLKCYIHGFTQLVTFCRMTVRQKLSYFFFILFLQNGIYTQDLGREFGLQQWSQFLCFISFFFFLILLIKLSLSESHYEYDKWFCIESSWLVTYTEDDTFHFVSFIFNQKATLLYI